MSTHLSLPITITVFQNNREENQQGCLIHFKSTTAPRNKKYKEKEPNSISVSSEQFSAW